MMKRTSSPRSMKRDPRTELSRRATDHGIESEVRRKVTFETGILSFNTI